MIVYNRMVFSLINKYAWDNAPKSVYKVPILIIFENCITNAIKLGFTLFLEYYHFVTTFLRKNLVTI